MNPEKYIFGKVFYRAEISYLIIVDTAKVVFKSLEGRRKLSVKKLIHILLSEQDEVLIGSDCMTLILML